MPSVPSQDKDQPSKRICLGKITDAHGVKGLVKLLPFGDDTNLLDGTLFTAESGENTLSITLKNPVKKHYIAEINGITDRTAAENLRGTELWIERDKLPPPAEGEFYIEDLIGLDAVGTDGSTIGKVIALENFGASDLLEIRPTSGDTFYLPFTKDNIPDVADDKITIIIPEET